MPTTLIPKKTDVIVHPLQMPDTTAGGLIRPESFERRENQGIIVAVGSEAAEQGLETAQHVLFSGYAGNHIAVEEGGFFIVLHWQSIDAIIGDSDVMLLSTNEVKKLINDRFKELRMKDPDRADELNVIEESLLDRVQSYIQTYGFLF